MKKILVAAAVLLLAGIAAAGAVHVKTSLQNGVCPLTGKPIHRSVPASVARPSESAASDSTFAVNVVADGAAPSAAAADDDQTLCPKTRRHCCCPNRHECAPAPVEEKPAVPQTQNP